MVKMKQAIIIHGWGGSPEEPLLKWIKKQLENKNYEVSMPLMPDTDEPKITIWVNKIKETIKNPDENTYFIGHSIGCQAILRYLETLNKKVGEIILIAPWMYLDEKTIEEEEEGSIKIIKPWIETPIKWNKAKECASNFVCIFSDNDPYVPVDNKELFEEKLNATIIIEHNKGHFDPSSNVNELGVIKDLI